MKPNEILSASLIDVIFDGRNKDYGAYELRKTYSRRLKRALLVTIVAAGLAFGGAALANSFNKKKSTYQMKEITELKAIIEEIPEKLPEPERQPEPEPVRTEQFTTLQIKPDEEVTQPPPSIEDLDSSKIADETREGRPDINTSEPPPDLDGQKGVIQPKSNEPEEPFTSVEIDAKYNGNWKAFLERNLNANVPRDNDAPAGRYSVVIQFVVDKEGNVSDIKALTEHGYGMEAESLRVIKKAARWEPAIQNGIPVKAYKKQVIIFEVLGDE
jgi:protein TonB